jgi:hypothetical protein
MMVPQAACVIIKRLVLPQQHSDPLLLQKPLMPVHPLHHIHCWRASLTESEQRIHLFCDVLR